MYNGNYKVASLVYIYNVFVCSKTIFSPVVVSEALWTGFSMICYIKIFKNFWRTSHTGIVGWQQPKPVFPGLGGGECSTGVVFAFLLTSVMNLIFVLIAGWIYEGPKVEKPILLINIVELLSAFLDPLHYVLCFRECRFILMKNLTFFFPSMRGTVEQMRSEVYDIVTVSQFRTSTVCI